MTIQTYKKEFNVAKWSEIFNYLNDYITLPAIPKEYKDFKGVMFIQIIEKYLQKDLKENVRYSLQTCYDFMKKHKIDFINFDE